MTTEIGTYITGLQRNFSKYRRNHFAGQEGLFEPRAEGGRVVFNRGHVENNLLIPPCTAEERDQIVGKIPTAKRHKHFGSMQSSQALAQSVFGAIEVLGRLPLLSGVKAEDGRPAFDSMLGQTNLEFEKEVQTLGEQPGRATSVDVWFEGPHRVAVECKLAESRFGTCSRTRLTEKDPQHCDGNYAQQGIRTERCALTEINVHYWKYSEAVFGWSNYMDHRPCPMNDTYQLVRNVLAACLNKDCNLDADSGHALIIYDQRNPAMATDGACNRSWRTAYEALRAHSTLRRISWQAFIAQ